MIGDYRGLSRALALCKAIAAYNMVYVHGSLLMTSFTPTFNYTTYRWLPIAIFRGFSSLCLPAFAGYYMRAEAGPVLSDRGSLPSDFIKRGFHFFCLAVILEAIRLSTTLLTPAYIFNWQALHFIGLAMMVTYIILYLNPKWIGPFFVLILLLRTPLETLVPIPTPRLTDTPLMSLASWIWSAALVAIVAWVVVRLHIYRLFERATRQPIVAKCIFVVLSAAILIAGQKWVEGHPRSLVSLVNLPYSIFLPHPTDDNYWSFFVFYPIFMFGYFIRAVLFDLKYRKYFPLINAVAVALATRLVITGISDFAKTVTPKTPFSKALFALGALDILGVCALSYLVLMALYYLMRDRRLMEPFRTIVFFSRSVLMLYLVHEPVFLVLRVIFPFSVYERLSPTEGLLTGFFLLNLGYILSLVLSHICIKFLEQRQARMSENISVMEQAVL